MVPKIKEAAATTEGPSTLEQLLYVLGRTGTGALQGGAVAGGVLGAGLLGDYIYRRLAGEDVPVSESIPKTIPTNLAENAEENKQLTDESRARKIQQFGIKSAAEMPWGLGNVGYGVSLPIGAYLAWRMYDALKTRQETSELQEAANELVRKVRGPIGYKGTSEEQTPETKKIPATNKAAQAYNKVPVMDFVIDQLCEAGVGLEKEAWGLESTLIKRIYPKGKKPVVSAIDDVLARLTKQPGILKRYLGFAPSIVRPVDESAIKAVVKNLGKSFVSPTTVDEAAKAGLPILANKGILHSALRLISPLRTKPQFHTRDLATGALRALSTEGKDIKAFSHLLPLAEKAFGQSKLTKLIPWGGTAFGLVPGAWWLGENAKSLWENAANYGMRTGAPSQPYTDFPIKRLMSGVGKGIRTGGSTVLDWFKSLVGKDVLAPLIGIGGAGLGIGGLLGYLGTEEYLRGKEEEEEKVKVPKLVSAHG